MFKEIFLGVLFARRLMFSVLASIGSDVDQFIECMSHRIKYIFLCVCDSSELVQLVTQSAGQLQHFPALFSKTDASNFRSFSHRDSVTRLELECSTNLVIQRCSKHLLPLLVRRSNKKNRIRYWRHIRTLMRNRKYEMVFTVAILLKML